MELNNYEKALQQAHRARELGYEGTNLEKALRRAGRWQEPYERGQPSRDGESERK